MATTNSEPLTSTLPFPHSPDSTLHISVTSLSTSYLIFLTSKASSAGLLSSIPLSEETPSANPGADATSSLADTSLLTAGFDGGGLAIPHPIPSSSALGSFVYGIPNRFSPTEPLTTALVSVPTSLELATRLCRILVRKLGAISEPKPVYLGCSIALDGYGDQVEEEMAIVRSVIEEVVRLVQSSSTQVNGIKA